LSRSDQITDLTLGQVGPAPQEAEKQKRDSQSHADELSRA